MCIYGKALNPYTNPTKHVRSRFDNMRHATRSNNKYEWYETDFPVVNNHALILTPSSKIQMLYDNPSRLADGRWYRLGVHSRPCQKCTAM